MRMSMLGFTCIWHQRGLSHHPHRFPHSEGPSPLALQELLWCHIYVFFWSFSQIWSLWWPGMWWEQLLARRPKWLCFSELEDASWWMKSGIPRQCLWHFSSVRLRWWLVRMVRLNSTALRVKTEFVVRRWPATEPQWQKLKPDWMPPWWWNKKILAEGSFFPQD